MADHDALTPWSAVDEGDADGFRSYLDTVSGVERIEALKRRSYSLLDLDADDSVLDAGCGTGDDALTLCDEVLGPAGAVVGVDSSLAMVETARNRAGETVGDSAGSQNTDSAETAFCVGDATRLPFPDGVVDGARSDRVLQHLPHPRRAFQELVRVTRPSGRVVITDTDWGTLTVAAGNEALDDRLVDSAWSCAATGEVGRRLRGWAVDTGLTDLDVDTTTLSFADFEAADGVLGVTGRIERLQAAGEVSDETAASWLATLHEADDAGTFFASLTLFTVAGTVP
jgi:ubiquinone/menaquinone biosynthesis C-methylase UbiE